MPPTSGPEADAPVRGVNHAKAALAECGVTLDVRLHAGHVVDVYRGRLRSGEPVAAKITNAQARGEQGAVALVAREHRTIARLEHPHIVGAVGFAARDGAAVLVLEHLAGGDLVSLAGDPPQRWASAVLAVARALQATHEAGVVHGDVKARNVLFDATGQAKLIDFGSALDIGRRRGRGGRTPAHEPLRFAFEHASPELDVYALAVLLYELATGRLPFGPAPGQPRPVPPWPHGGPAIRALAARVAATLDAAGPKEVGTLLEFADVLESVHQEAAGATGSSPAGPASGAAVRVLQETRRAPQGPGERNVLDD